MRGLLADMEAGKDVRARAAALAADLPNLIPDDPALAAVIAEEMAKEFNKPLTDETPADKPAPASGNRTGHDGAGEAASQDDEGEIEITQEMAESFVRSLPDA